MYTIVCTLAGGVTEAHVLIYESLHWMSIDKKLSSVLPPPSHSQLSHTNVAQMCLLRYTWITLRLHSIVNSFSAFQRSSPLLYNYIECRCICRFLLSSIRSQRSEFDKYFLKDFIWWCCILLCCIVFTLTW